MKIIVSQEIESVCPTFVGAYVEAHVENPPYLQGTLGSKVNDAQERKFRQFSDYRIAQGD